MQSFSCPSARWSCATVGRSQRPILPWVQPVCALTHRRPTSFSRRASTWRMSYRAHCTISSATASMQRGTRWMAEAELPRYAVAGGGVGWGGGARPRPWWLTRTQVTTGNSTQAQGSASLSVSNSHEAGPRWPLSLSSWRHSRPGGTRANRNCTACQSHLHQRGHTWYAMHQSISGNMCRQCNARDAGVVPSGQQAW